MTEQQPDLVRVLWGGDDEPSDIVAAVHFYSKWCLKTDAQLRRAYSLEEYIRDIQPGVSNVCLNAMQHWLMKSRGVFEPATLEFVVNSKDWRMPLHFALAFVWREKIGHAIGGEYRTSLDAGATPRKSVATRAVSSIWIPFVAEVRSVGELDNTHLSCKRVRSLSN